MTVQRQIVYILSTNYAGSHLLALQLGSHSRCRSVGELHHFRRKDTRHRVCSMCASEELCPVLAGIRGRPAEKFYDIIFDNLSRSYPLVSTVVDNSKKVQWASRFSGMPGYTMKYIHLIRDPRALVRRWKLSFEPGDKFRRRLKTARRCWRHAWEILTGGESRACFWHWLYQNQQITDFLERNRLDFRLVTYHDLVMKADEVLGELMGWLGYEHEPLQKEYWNFSHHGSVKKDYLKPPQDGELYFDQRWKKELDEKTQREIYNHPSVADYLNKIGVFFDYERGLTIFKNEPVDGNPVSIG
ncbi:MAG: hypothetical protein WHS88_08640 [Anaerohalosphaeraceae bacterium]